MRLLRNYLVVLASFVFLALAAPPSAYAWNPFGAVDCSGKAASSAVCSDRSKTENPITGPDGLVMDVINIVAFVAGAIAIVIIILAGLRFITSSGGSEDVAGARRTIIYATVGLVVIVLARVLVALVLNMI